MIKDLHDPLTDDQVNEALAKLPPLPENVLAVLRNLAARMGRWSASHWKTATFGWLALVVVAFALGSMVGTKQVAQNDPGPGESGRMQKILDQSFKQPAGESVLIQSSSSRVVDPAFTSAIGDVVAGV